MLLYEFKADLNAYLGALGPSSPVHSLADVIAFNEQHRDREMPYFGQEIMIQAEEKGPLTDPGVHGGAGEGPPAVADAGHRRGDDEASSSTRSSRRLAGPPG